MARKKRVNPWRDEEEPEDTTEPEPESIEDTQDIPIIQETEEPAKVDEPPPSTPKEELSAIPLKVFVRVAGPKWDQMAGFLSYAKTKKMGPRTVPEWRAAYQAFLQKPVR